MENIAASLKTLKINMPGCCSQANLFKLQSGFLKYKELVTGLPDTYLQIKNEYERHFILLEYKISIITDSANSGKDSKYYFKEALYSLCNEIDNIAESVMSRDHPANNSYPVIPCQNTKQFLLRP